MSILISKKSEDTFYCILNICLQINLMTLVKAVVSYLEKEASIQKIRAWSHIENSASIKVLKSAGFQQVATKENQIIFEFECETNA